MEDREVDRKNLRRHDADDDLLASEPIEGPKWERLIEPPRVVPISIRLRLAIAKQSHGIRQAAGGGTVCLIASLFLVLLDEPSSAAFVWGTGLLGAALLFSVVCSLYLRTQQAVDVLARGEIRSCRIVGIYDRSTEDYGSYESVLEKIGRLFSWGSELGIDVLTVNREYQDWPVMLLVEGSENQINARVDLRSRAMKTKTDSRARVMVADQGGRQRVVMIEQFPWLSVSDAGEFEYGLRQEAENFGFGKSLARSFLVVLPTYMLVLCGFLFGANPLFNADMASNGTVAVRVFLVSFFTLTHAAGPVLFYHHHPAFRNMFTVGFWYGAPILLLASLSGWLSLAWVALYILWAG
ncbi:MAG TPA: hypothetical protein EYN03_01985, partial [Planctomycetes bacterium]|nr:hypothetical protein [Planctomycetota bacterium]